MNLAANRKSFYIGAFLLLIAPFVLLAASYHALPARIPALRIRPGAWTYYAAKTPFAVFRVPAMNAMHGMIAAVMLSRAADFNDPARRAGYSRLFSTLLIAIGLKSGFEAIELSARAAPSAATATAAGLPYATVISVVPASRLRSFAVAQPLCRGLNYGLQTGAGPR